MFKIVKINSVAGKVVKTLECKDFIFPAGEVSVKLNAKDYGYRELAFPNTIVARIQNSDDLFKLAMVKDALARFDANPINLFLPYVPYARQDRVCDGGESFSLVVLARFIHSLAFDKVTIVDPHSEVTPAAFEALGIKLTVIKQIDVLYKFLEFSKIAGGALLVSPDAGSNKKTSDAAGYYGHESFIRADKLRDLSNGKIKEIVVYADDLKGRDVVILDDLCELGGTFLGLAKVLKEKNCGKIHLYVTHGVFGNENKNKVLTNLLANSIDNIWTTNSYHEEFPNMGPILRVFDLEAAFADKI